MPNPVSTDRGIQRPFLDTGLPTHRSYPPSSPNDDKAGDTYLLRLPLWKLRSTTTIILQTKLPPRQRRGGAPAAGKTGATCSVDTISPSSHRYRDDLGGRSAQGFGSFFTPVAALGNSLIIKRSRSTPSFEVDPRPSARNLTIPEGPIT